jgi:hypothetical protein
MTLTLKNRIMLGVYAVYTVRWLRNPLVGEAAVFAILAIALSIFVSIPSVVSNMLDAESSYRYFLAAFYETELLVQLVTISTLVVLSFLTHGLVSYTGLRRRLA